MYSFKNNLSNNQGVIAIITLLVITTLAIAIVSTVSAVAIDELKMVNAGGVIDKTFYAAEAGLNEGMYRLGEGVIVPVTYNFNLEGIDVEVTLSGKGYDRTVRATSTDPGGRIRVLEIDATASSFAGGFESAIHGGAGGIYLENGSKIIGKVHSNGGIYPDSNGSTGNIEGSVSISGQFPIQDVIVTGNVEAYQALDSTIFGTLTFGGDEATATVGTTVAGAPCGNPVSNTNCSYIAGRELSDKPPPITTAEIEFFRDQEVIAKIGTDAVDLFPDPSKCPASIPNPTEVYCIDRVEEIIGLARINGDLYIGGSVANQGILSLDSSFLYVTGKIIIGNNTAIKVNSNNPSLEKKMVVIIAEGIVDIHPNTNVTPFIDPITGVVDDKSFILLSTLSTSEDLDEPAIHASNNSNSIVFAAVEGTLKVKQNGELVAAAAKTLYLENNATVTYNPQLASFSTGSGGGEEVGTSFGSWREL